MATTFYPRDLNIGIDSYKLADLSRGSSPVTVTTNTQSGATWILIDTWSTNVLEPFTLSGSVSSRIRAFESNVAANVGVEWRIYKWSKATGLSSLVLALSSAELTTTEASINLSGTPTSTTFASGDSLVFEIGLINAGGTMAASRTATISYNGGTLNATGDAFITITENIQLRNRVLVTE